MSTVNPKELCMGLIKSDSEEEVVELLSEAGFWDNSHAWRFYGDYEGNYGMIGNQSASAPAALAEKIVNSVDARLIGECRLRNIDPEGPDAPQSIRGAVARFFEENPEGGTAGIVTEWPAQKRTEVAKGMTVAATGFKPTEGNPSITVVDCGEGQTPSALPKTILSLTRSNKARIPFVQGRYNMGGSGALRFCGRENLQLVVTRRNPALLPEVVDEEDRCWSFTVVRREASGRGMRNSVYTYLAPVGASGYPGRGKVLTFDPCDMPLFPERDVPYIRETGWGTLIKLYEYALGGRSHILRRGGVLRQMDLLLPGVALPVRLHECRGFRGALGSHATNLAGIRVRLSDPNSDVLEPGYPATFEMRVEGQPITGTTYVFKKGTAGTYKTEEGVVCVVNGQSHGHLPKSFFRRKELGFGYIDDSILILADCSSFENRAREDLVMTSRDRLADSPIRHALEQELVDALRADAGLKELNNRRRQEEVAEKFADDKPMEMALQKVLRASPTLAALFLDGDRISSPFRTTQVGVQDKFKGKRFPTYFKFEGIEYGEKLSRDCNINRKCRITFVTDAENDYLDRSVQSGEFDLRQISPGQAPVSYDNYSLNLQNGRANLTLKLPHGGKEGDMVEFEALLTDPSRVEPFVNHFALKIIPPASGPSGPGTRKKPPSKQEGEDHESSAELKLPRVRPVYENEFKKLGFTDRTALTIKNSGETVKGEAVYDFFLNMDNLYLLRELKYTRLEPELVREQFKIGLVLLGLALIHDRSDGGSQDSSEPEQSVEEQVEAVTRAAAPIILPLVHTVSELDARTR